MTDVTMIVDSYVAVWNEPDAAERRRRIRSAWPPDGTTCYKLLESDGYDAIEARVTRSWDKWLRDGRYIFRPKHAVCHHDVVKFDWVMVTVPGGEIHTTGRSFLMLTPEGRIRHDYQFSPTANDATELVERYVAVLNEPSAQLRRHRIARLWAPDGRYVCDTVVRKGYTEIEAAAVEAHETHVTKGFKFCTANASDRHHNLASITWQVQAKDDGRITAGGSDLLILDEAGRIQGDYQFAEPISAFAPA